MTLDPLWAKAAAAKTIKRMVFIGLSLRLNGMGLTDGRGPTGAQFLVDSVHS
jgi:hypothetical protein